MASLGLVADYSSSDSDSSDTEKGDAGDDNIRVSTKGNTSQVSRNFLTAGDGSDSSEEEAEMEPPKLPIKSIKLPNPLSEKLPSPLLTGNSNTSSIAGSSVFVTAYHKAEEAKNSVLEKHVKMTVVDLQKGKRKKQICYKFHKGNCRFGSKCRFAHDNDDIPSSSSSSQTDNNKEANQATPHSNHSNHQNSNHQSYIMGHDQPVVHQDDEDYLSQAKKKKRIGTTDTLLPPKKAMKSLDRQRVHERPWTIQNH